MNEADVVSSRVENGIAVVTLGSARRIFFDPEMSQLLLEALSSLASDDDVRVVIVTGGAPGYFIRHYSVSALIDLGERVQASGRPWSENEPYKPGSLDAAAALCETMPKPVIAAISGSCMGGGFEFVLASDIRIAEEGAFQIGLPEINVGILPGSGGTQRLPRIVGVSTALKHILMGRTLTPREAAEQGFVHEAVNGRALDRALDIARHLSGHTRESIAHIKRLVRGAPGMPLADGLKLERNLFMQLCASEGALTRMRDLEAKRRASDS